VKPVLQKSRLFCFVSNALLIFVKMMYYRILYFCVFVFTCYVSAQSDMRYLEHLYQQKEYSLLQHEIKQIYETKTSFNKKEQGKICFFQYQIGDTVNSYFLPVIQKALHIKKRKLFSGTPQNEEEKYLYHVSKAYSVRKTKEFTPVLCQDTFLIQQYAVLYKIQQEYLKKSKKSGLLAGSMSAVVPGLGKVYAGKPVQMVAPLLGTILWTAQAAEIAIKSGYTHFAFWIPAGIGTIFYFSNIYGSYNVAKQYNAQQKQLYHAQLDTLLDTFVEYYSQR